MMKISPLIEPAALEVPALLADWRCGAAAMQLKDFLEARPTMLAIHDVAFLNCRWHVAYELCDRLLLLFLLFVVHIQHALFQKEKASWPEVPASRSRGCGDGGHSRILASGARSYESAKRKEHRPHLV